MFDLDKYLTTAEEVILAPAMVLIVLVSVVTAFPFWLIGIVFKKCYHFVQLRRHK